MSLTPPESVQKLRSSLHAKAKGSPGYRFYALYDKVYRPDVLAYAYQCCKVPSCFRDNPDLRVRPRVTIGGAI